MLFKTNVISNGQYQQSCKCLEKVETLSPNLLSFVVARMFSTILTEYASLSGDDNPWTCRNCTNFHFSESYFEYDSETEPSGEDIDTHSPTPDIFDQLRTARKKFPNRFLCAYLNINSLRYKFDSIKDLLTQNIVDLLFISETKLDDSFVNAQFSVTIITFGELIGLRTEEAWQPF